MKRGRLLPILARLPFGVYLALSGVTLLLCIYGMFLFFITAGGRTYQTFQIAEEAVPVHGVNGLAVDKDGTIYEGTVDFSSVQVFDCHGNFLYRYCIPTHKAAPGSFYWRLEDDGTLIIYTYRDYACLTVQDGQMVRIDTFDSREVFENAVQSAGLSLHGNALGECVQAGRTYKASLGGKVRSWPLDRLTEVTTVALQVPHWPPPVFVCWIMCAVGLLGTVILIGTAVKVDEQRQLPISKRK